MTNNVLHGLLCIFTGGLWLPCWLLACCCDDDEGNHHHHRNNNNTTIINQNINSSGERRPLRGKAQQAKKKGQNAGNSGTSGQVSETLADGATFKGHKAKGQRQGFGVYCYPQGDNRLKYEGAWSNNLKHGQGVLHYRDGSRYEGQWANGVRQGHGTSISASGAITQAVWVGDKQHGRAKAGYSPTAVRPTATLWPVRRRACGWWWVLPTTAI